MDSFAKKAWKVLAFILFLIVFGVVGFHFVKHDIPPWSKPPQRESQKAGSNSQQESFLQKLSQKIGIPINQSRPKPKKGK